jgi:tetratricopeptide (TPR) repeat protein
MAKPRKQAEPQPLKAAAAAKGTAAKGTAAKGTAAKGTAAAKGAGAKAAVPKKTKGAAARATKTSPEALDLYTQALTVMGRKEWDRAAGLFEKVIAQSDQPELAGRARQLLAACRQQTAQSRPAPATEADDPYLLAVVEKNRGDFKRALEICRQGGRDKKDERFAYLAASIHALENRTEEAVQALSRAVELDPKNRIHAFHDADFSELRRNRDHRHLFGLS